MKVGTDGVLLGAWAAMPDGSAPESVLDIGAGSGLIALMAAQRWPSARITAVEISHEACLDAITNAEASPWADRIGIVESDITDFRPDMRFDLIISNPPFFSETLHAPDAARATARHGDTFGVEQLIRMAPQFLSGCGSLCFIAPSGRDSEIDFLAELARLHTTAAVKVYSKEGAGQPVRTLRRLSMRTSSCLRGEFCLRTSSGAISEAYASLTKDFYLRI